MNEAKQPHMNLSHIYDEHGRCWECGMPEHCFRCKERIKDDEDLAEIMIPEDHGNGETGPMIRMGSAIIHAGCIWANDEIA